MPEHKLYLHIFNYPDDEWNTWNMGIVSDSNERPETPSYYEDSEHRVELEYECVELVPGLRLFADGYDRASLEVIGG